jgi:hypothetical protein
MRQSAMHERDATWAVDAKQAVDAQQTVVAQQAVDAEASKSGRCRSVKAHRHLEPSRFPSRRILVYEAADAANLWGVSLPTSAW